MNLEIKHVAQPDLIEKNKTQPPTTLTANQKYPLVYFVLSILLLIVSEMISLYVKVFESTFGALLLAVTSLAAVYTSWITLQRSAHRRKIGYFLLTPLCYFLLIYSSFVALFYLKLMIQVISGTY